MIIALFIVILVALILLVLFNVRTVQKKKNDHSEVETENNLQQAVNYVNVEHGDSEYRDALRNLAGVAQKPKATANLHTVIKDDQKYRDALRSFSKPRNKS